MEIELNIRSEEFKAVILIDQCSFPIIKKKKMKEPETEKHPSKPKIHDKIIEITEHVQGSRKSKLEVIGELEKEFVPQGVKKSHIQNFMKECVIKESLDEQQPAENSKQKNPKSKKISRLSVDPTKLIETFGDTTKEPEENLE